MNIILETTRLRMRPFTMEDLNTCLKYAADPENVAYMEWGPNGEKETVEYLERKQQQYAADPLTEYDFAICLRDTGEHIGGGGLYLNADRNVAMAGWILQKDYWKKGFGTEFCAEMLRFGFDDLGLHRIYATCNAENYGSYRVMERNAMRREAHFRDVKFTRVGDERRWVDEYYYAILTDEWKNRKD